MTAYVVLLLCLMVGAAVKEREVRVICIFCSALILCTTYLNGSDWRAYELVYTSGTEALAASNYWSAAYLGLSRLAIIIGAPFQEYVITLKLIVFLAIYRFSRRYFPQEPALLPLFLILSGLHLFVDNPLRQFLAVPFLLWCTGYIYDKRWPLALLCAICGVLFHPSMVIAFVPHLIPARLRSDFLGQTILLLFCVLLFINIANISSILALVYEPAGFYLRHYVINHVDDYQVPVGSVLVIFGMYMVAMIVENRHVHKRLGDIPWKYSVALVFIIFAAGINEAFLRMAHYFSFFYAVYILETFRGARPKARWVGVLLLMLFSILPINLIVNSGKYLPYTSYPVFILEGKKLTYEEKLDRAEKL